MQQNQSWGASPQTALNLERFERGAHVAVSGQQVGLFGGPLFTIFKALTAIKLAEEATRQGVDCVPVFWLAGEDHDLAEVNHVSILGPDYSIQKLQTSTRGSQDAPVGELRFGAEIAHAMEEAAESLGDNELVTLLRETYREGETFGTAFAKLLAKLFGAWGLILIDGSDPALRTMAAPIFHDAIERSAELNHALLERGKELEAAGYHQQVKVTRASTLLFAIQQGARVPIHRRSDGGQPMEFSIGKEWLNQGELLRRIKETPEEFSPNVLLRPIVQDYFLPTLAYAGGPAEVAYFAQGGVVYKALAARITPIVPRISATLIGQKANGLLDRYDLEFSDLFEGPVGLQETVAKRTLPNRLQKAFEDAAGSLDSSLLAIRSQLEQLDPTLVSAAKTSASKMRHQIEQLRGKAARAEVRRNEILTRHANFLSNMLYPNKDLQEREIAGVYFLAKYGLGLIATLHEALEMDCVDHQVVQLES